MKSVYRRFRFLRPLINLRHLWYAWSGARAYGYPSEELFVIGVTGTSGKSSTIDFLRQLLEQCGHTVGSLSTVDFYIAGSRQMNDKKMTMLGKTAIQEYVRKMVIAGCSVAIVETTSEGRVQHRHRFINYDIMALTNFYPEHIDSHGSLAAYRRAKVDLFRYTARQKRKKLEGPFAKASKRKAAVVNADVPGVNDFLQENFDEAVTFGTSDHSDFHISNVSMEKDGLHFTCRSTALHAPVFGMYNATNIACALAIAAASGVPTEKLFAAVSTLKPVAGRIERIEEAQAKGFQVIVDYAFEPVAIAALYDVARLFAPKRIIHVFGSTGGGRDVERRFTVGEYVGTHADICIVTDEDPYDDDPMDIIRDVASAVKKAGKREGETMHILASRRDAIRKAISLAKPGDLVLITGKGSEQAMVVKGKLVPWDDREEVRAALRLA